ncbi:methylated-DNA--[protein]-cysteine S-methyltransferase [Alcaligenaceae bacterium]|nr:methylated-DNA--[protein]-cysteine S-methyltransferase [Alcaligenaceae bacterium]
MKLLQRKLASPIGDMLLVTDEAGCVRALDFEGYQAHLHRLLHLHYGNYELRDSAQNSDVATRLQRYFSGDLHALDDIAVANNGSALQQQAWAALRQIPPGHVLSYSELAAQLGRPKAARMVGGINASNPVAIIVPCHRVVAKNGDLRGYAWGLERKRWLLAHEGAEHHKYGLARLTGA